MGRDRTSTRRSSHRSKRRSWETSPLRGKLYGNLLLMYLRFGFMTTSTVLNGHTLIVWACGTNGVTGTDQVDVWNATAGAIQYSYQPIGIPLEQGCAAMVGSYVILIGGTSQGAPSNLAFVF